MSALTQKPKLEYKEPEKAVANPSLFNNLGTSPTKSEKWRIVVINGGEGNGNPLQCSCLENPRDRGAWGAAVSGAAESDTTEAT